MAVVTPTLADAITASLLHAREAKSSSEEAAVFASMAGLAAVNEVANVWQGIHASDPGLRPDGAPLQSGDQYYNSVSRSLRMYIDGSWSTVALTVAAGVLVAGQNLNDVSSKSQARSNLGLGTAATRNAGVAYGVAELDVNGHVVAAQVDVSGSGGLAAANNLSDLDDAGEARTSLGLGDAATRTIGAANGAAGLDSNGQVPVAQLPVNLANGVAALNASGFVPNGQLNAGQANGIAQLDAGGKVPASQLPAFGAPVTVTKSIDYTTVAGDDGKVIFVTTGSSADVSIRLVGAGSAGDGATMIVQKADSGTKKVIVKDSDGTTQIAWLSNQYDSVAFRSNGSSWSIFWHKIAPRVETFAANGTWTKAPLAKTVFVDLQGPGGGGGGGGHVAANNTIFGGNGGAGGARLKDVFRASDLASTEAVVVPAGGTAGTASATSTGGAGGDGSAASFGTTIRMSVNGGKGAAGASTSVQAGTAGGAVWDVGVATTNGASFMGAGAASGAASPGNSAHYGGASGGISSNGATGAAGGSSIYAGGGGGAGGGGNAGATQYAGGAGGLRGAYSAGGGASGGAGGSNNVPGGTGTAGPSAGMGGGGGGCGHASLSSAAGVGGDGGVGAGGGGGGSTHDSNSHSGANGGAGGRGECVVTTVFA